MAKEKKFARITIYADPNQINVADRVEVDYQVRLEGDEDMGEWNPSDKTLNFFLDGTGDGVELLQAIKDIVQARLGLT